MNPIITKRCSPIEEGIYQDGFEAGAASRDAEVAQWQKIIDEEAKDSALVIIERDQLRAQINVLREALSKMHDTYFKTDEDEELCEMALASTPEQSLAEYRNNVIEECASVCDKRSMRKNDGNWTDYEWDSICGTNELAADEIRAMKEQP